MNLIPSTLCALLLVGCASTTDYGGYVHSYADAGRAIRASGQMWQIPRICYSACTVKADLARPYACLGRKSQLGFHAVLNGLWVTDPRFIYSPDLAAALPGELPRAAHDVSRAHWMPRDQALKFWKEC